MGKALAILSLAFACGCVYKGAKVVEGTDLTVGMELPGSDGVAQLNVINYLSGFRLGVSKNAELEMAYTVAETNDFLGCIHTRTYKAIKAKVYPTEGAEK